MFLYILTNKTKTTLYIGITNDLSRRLYEHRKGLGKPNSFTFRYKCHYLIYYEEYATAIEAIQREKELKKWRREKKENLIGTMNPTWDFLEVD